MDDGSLPSICGVAFNVAPSFGAVLLFFDFFLFFELPDPRLFNLSFGRENGLPPSGLEAPASSADCLLDLFELASGCGSGSFGLSFMVLLYMNDSVIATA